MSKNINAKNQYKKGELIVNNLGWAGIVMEGTRGNDPTIINLVEMFGFEHEGGSIYTDDRIGDIYVERRINKAEFEALITAQGHKVGDYYFKGELLEPIN